MQNDAGVGEFDLYVRLRVVFKNFGEGGYEHIFRQLRYRHPPLPTYA